MGPTLLPLLFLAAAGTRVVTGPQEPASADALRPPVRLRVVLDSPGGELPFELLVPAPETTGPSYLENGSETIRLPAPRREGDRWVFEFPPYDSELVFRRQIGDRLHGRWTKKRGDRPPTSLSAKAEASLAPRFERLPPPRRRLPAPDGRYAVSFSSDPHPAVGIFSVRSDGIATGTFLTALGDYRYLAGDWNGESLRLSCFDGAHAFLFAATADAMGKLKGEFWSGDAWHETWTAVPDAEAELEDPFGLTRWREDARLDALRFPDLEGRTQSLSALRGERGTVLHLFGTWCPNCNDAARVMAELDRRYRDRGLAVVGLAFEHDQDTAANAARVHRFHERNGGSYPVLIAGLSDKAEASKSFPALDRVLAFPTTVFLDGDGRAVAVHTGFSGPATGTAHLRLVERFESLIENLLAD